MKIGEKIRRARNSKRYSQARLGELVGVTRSAVSQWESGQVINIELHNRIALSEHLEIAIAELLPEKATAGDVVIKDSRRKLLIELFDSMPEQQQEAYLRLALVMQGNPKDSAPQSG